MLRDNQYHEGIDNPRLRGRKRRRKNEVIQDDTEGIDNPRLRGRKPVAGGGLRAGDVEGIDNPRLRGRKQSDAHVQGKLTQKELIIPDSGDGNWCLR